MPGNVHNNKPLVTTIAPWLSVKNSAADLPFYKAAFGATESFLLEDPGGAIVAGLYIEGAEFWLSDESPEHGNFSPATVGGGTVRIIVTVADPETFFSRALAAGATQVFPVREEYGWKLGRLVDPFGHHWEIGHQLEDQ